MEMKRSNKVVLAIFLLSTVLAGCFGSGQDSAPDNTMTASATPEASMQQPEETGKNTASLTVYNLLDQWERATENVLEIPENRKHLYDLSGFQLWRDRDRSLKLFHVWGELKNEDHVSLTGYARKDDGRIDRLYIMGKQTDFDEEDLERLRPYYESLIAVSNPGLSDRERSDIMRELFLEGADAATLAENTEHTLTVNDVRYVVTYIGSSEGRTFALVATLAADCAADDVLAACR